jgi:predicted nucleotidyltransferase
VGGVAENRITVYSDIDIVIGIGSRAYKNIEAIVEIKHRAKDIGLPLEAPIDIKIATEDKFRESLGKLYRSVIDITPIFKFYS